MAFKETQTKSDVAFRELLSKLFNTERLNTDAASDNHIDTVSEDLVLEGTITEKLEFIIHTTLDKLLTGDIDLDDAQELLTLTQVISLFNTLSAKKCE